MKWVCVYLIINGIILIIKDRKKPIWPIVKEIYNDIYEANVGIPRKVLYGYIIIRGILFGLPLFIFYKLKKML